MKNLHLKNLQKLDLFEMNMEKNKSNRKWNGR